MRYSCALVECRIRLDDPCDHLRVCRSRAEIRRTLNWGRDGSRIRRKFVLRQIASSPYTFDAFPALVVINDAIELPSFKNGLFMWMYLPPKTP